jgi:hypothetical protein
MRKYSRKKRAENKSALSSDYQDDLLGWITSELINSVVEGYNLGISIEDIAKEWEVPEETIIQILLLSGIEIIEKQ